MQAKTAIESPGLKSEAMGRLGGMIRKKDPRLLGPAQRRTVSALGVETMGFKSRWRYSVTCKKGGCRLPYAIKLGNDRNSCAVFRELSERRQFANRRSTNIGSRGKRHRR